MSEEIKPAPQPAEEPTAVEPATSQTPAELRAAPEPPAEDQGLDSQSSFADLLREFETTHTHRAESKQLEGTVVSLSAEQVFLDVGYKIEGVLPRSAFANNAEGVKAGDRFPGLHYRPQ